jgi:beta-glucanase (GH16 family)
MYCFCIGAICTPNAIFCLNLRKNILIKKYFLTALLFCASCSAYSQQMPIEFDDSQDEFQAFQGSSFSQRNDTNNTTNKVGQFYNDGSNKNQGFYIDVLVDIDVTQKISLSFYSFDSNAHNVLLKLENGTNPNIEVKQNFTVPTPSNWKTITFDFNNAKNSSNGTSVAAAGTYERLTIFIDQGNNTAGTYLIDNISDGNTSTDPNTLDVVYSDLVWSDEFDVNGAVDAEKWHHQTQIPAGGNWYNNEEQHYTNRIENSNVANGFLNITAKKENFTDQGYTKKYTSARLNSKYAYTYGRVDIRAKLPLGGGTWPAIWTLGKNINEDGGFWDPQYGTVNWPACGEIDVMEHGIHAVNEVSSALHTPSSFGNTVNSSKKMLSDVANDFHVYSMNWSPNQITFLIDGVAYYTYKPNTKNNQTWPFDQDQYLLLNIAMGGVSGTIDSDFTQSSMVIDYLRVYQNSTLNVPDVFADKFSIYPNPALSFISINSNEPVDKIAIYNSLGQLLRIKNNTKRMNLEDLQPGLYLMKIYSDSKIITKKVLIKN